MGARDAQDDDDDDDLLQILSNKMKASSPRVVWRWIAYGHTMSLRARQGKKESP
jgi:hypothetical protein